MTLVTAAPSHPKTITVHGATVPSLKRFIDREIPWVWILGHMPNAVVEWWRAELPLNAQGDSAVLDVRDLRFDMQLQTTSFLERIDAFRDHGIYLVQSRSPMPNTLDLRRISDDEHRQKVLRENGAVLTIDLPHAAETAVLCELVPGQLARCLEKEPAEGTGR